MNNERRKKIDDLMTKLDELKTELSDIAADERDYFDNMPEKLQAGARGQKADAAADILEEGEQTLDDLIASLGDATE